MRRTWMIVAFLHPLPCHLTRTIDEISRNFSPERRRWLVVELDLVRLVVVVKLVIRLVSPVCDRRASERDPRCTSRLWLRYWSPMRADNQPASCWKGPSVSNCPRIDDDLMTLHNEITNDQESTISLRISKLVLRPS